MRKAFIIHGPPGSGKSWFLKKLLSSGHRGTSNFSAVGDYNPSDDYGFPENLVVTTASAAGTVLALQARGYRTHVCAIDRIGDDAAALTMIDAFFTDEPKPRKAALLVEGQSALANKVVASIVAAGIPGVVGTDCEKHHDLLPSGFVAIVRDAEDMVMKLTAAGYDVGAMPADNPDPVAVARAFFGETATPEKVAYHGGDMTYGTIRALRSCLTITEYGGFLRGNAIKFLTTIGEKGEDGADAEKAAWYATKYAEFVRENGG